jgi:hypothetical protein
MLSKPQGQLEKGEVIQLIGLMAEHYKLKLTDIADKSTAFQHLANTFANYKNPKKDPYDNLYIRRLFLESFNLLNYEHEKKCYFFLKDDNAFIIYQANIALLFLNEFISHRKAKLKTKDLRIINTVLSCILYSLSITDG